LGKGGERGGRKKEPVTCIAHRFSASTGGGGGIGELGRKSPGEEREEGKKREKMAQIFGILMLRRRGRGGGKVLEKTPGALKKRGEVKKGRRKGCCAPYVLFAG